MRHFVFLLLLSLVFSCSPAKKYVEGSKHWEKEISELVSDSKTYPSESILFIGSSSIRLWDNIEKDMAPYPVIKRGFGGSNLKDVIVYEDRLVNPHSFRAVVVFVANDITGGKEDATPKEVFERYKLLVKSIRKEHKKEPIFWVQITPTESRWKVWDKIQEANTLIKNYTEKNKNLYYIETAEAFLGPDGKPIPAYFRADKLHLTQQGYDLWSGLIKASLNQHLK
ncbi:GDSL-type esterase/lipase family protein [Leadbetterella byssophila]|uniref:Esterase/lipase-like protein n=1 Tax=Leadbetterella byssophila (strain DSM 17132 / JCM 16389 / KACC 11308 / NBRC 106382 / 4M15) TaxID=649349 RepID=E4RS06_LEAB4|nr:GDSL-type esterase/lipase family protein [Leadbetterella byssophila]ADQ18538.1 esterase/lipase-like protein [Leadbetterella byssophila DSM 17132]